MKVILFGATGMVGSGVLLECLANPKVSSVLSVSRNPCGVTDPKLREIVRKDLFDLSDIRADLVARDACFFCLGVSSVGMKEDDYRRVTRDLTLNVAGLLAELNPGMTFCFVTGQNTDSNSSRMWARVKGETEDALLRMPLKSYMFRPGYIQPMKGVRSKTGWYQMFYNIMGPLYPLWRRLLPKYVTSTENVGRAMVRAATDGYDRQVLENPDINALGGGREQEAGSRRG